MALIDVGVY